MFSSTVHTNTVKQRFLFALVGTAIAIGKVHVITLFPKITEKHTHTKLTNSITIIYRQ